MKKYLLLAVVVLLAGCAAGAATKDRTQAPWRESDATIVQLCFDSMDRKAPDHLLAEEITDISLGSARPELVGFTLTDRPIYQVGLSHPVKFRSLLLQLPGATIKAVIDSPIFLESTVGVWRDAPSPALCTTDERASFALLRLGKVNSTVPCPDVGLSVSFKVISSNEFSSSRALSRSRGPVVFNGLKGCKEFVYKGQKK